MDQHREAAESFFRATQQSAWNDQALGHPEDLLKEHPGLQRKFGEQLDERRRAVGRMEEFQVGIDAERERRLAQGRRTIGAGGMAAETAVDSEAEWDTAAKLTRDPAGEWATKWAGRRKLQRPGHSKLRRGNRTDRWEAGGLERLGGDAPPQ